MKFPWQKKEGADRIERDYPECHIRNLDEQIEAAETFGKCCLLALKYSEPVQIILVMDGVLCPSAIALPNLFWGAGKQQPREALLDWLSHYSFGQKLKFQGEREEFLKVMAGVGNEYCKNILRQEAVNGPKQADL